MSVSPRTVLELVGAAILSGLLVWQVLTAAGLRTEKARLETALAVKDQVVQAHEVTARSCSAALEQVQVATGALAQATESAHAEVAAALQASAGQDQADAQVINQLLRQRPDPGRDCEGARGLALGAWEDGQ